MSAPVNVDELQGRIFAFYPPIRNFDHNEWRFCRAEWSEVLVANTKTGEEVWIPRRYFGKISSIDEPVMIVGLERELEYKGGSVWPYERRVVQMPASGKPAPPPAASAAQPPRAVSTQPSTERSVSRLIGGVLLTGVAVCLIVFAVYKAAALRPVKFTATDQDFLTLTRDDNYFAVVRKLGEPSETRWKSESGELQYQALWYPQRSYYVILMGADRSDARYIGALDRNWRVLHYVELRNGGNTASLLRALGKF